MVKGWQKPITGESLPQLNLLSKEDLLLLLFYARDAGPGVADVGGFLADIILDDNPKC